MFAVFYGSYVQVVERELAQRRIRVPDTKLRLRSGTVCLSRCRGSFRSGPKRCVSRVGPASVRRVRNVHGGRGAVGDDVRLGSLPRHELPADFQPGGESGHLRRHRLRQGYFSSNFDVARPRYFKRSW